MEGITKGLGKKKNPNTFVFWYRINPNWRKSEAEDCITEIGFNQISHVPASEPITIGLYIELSRLIDLDIEINSILSELYIEL